MSRSHWIRIPIGPLRIYIDQSHLYSSQWVFKVTLAGVPLIVQPRPFGSPVDIILGFPDVWTTATEAESFKAHGLQRHIPGKNEKVCPGNFTTVLLLDWPKQTTGLIEISIIGPAIKRSKALSTGPPASAAIRSTVSTGSMPGHPNEERTIVPKICRPPVLRIGHQIIEIFFKGIVIDGLKLFPIIKIILHRIGACIMLV